MPEDFIATVVTSSRDLGQVEHLEVPLNSRLALDERTSVHYVDARSVVAQAKSLMAVRRWRPEIVYLNGFFPLRSTIIPRFVHALGLLGNAIVVLAPRGEFGDAALAFKARKKYVYLTLFRLMNLEKKTIWHASSDREAEDIKRVFGPEVDVLVCENDTDLPPVPQAAAKDPDLVPKAVYVGRIVPIKGLHIVLESLAMTSSPFSFDIYGPEEDEAYAKECKRLAALTPEHVEVRWCGQLKSDEVRRAISNYDLFLMPTLGENFGHVIAESLSVSCPVVVADVTPWSERIRAGGGVLLADRTVESWRAAIEHQGRLSKKARSDQRSCAGDAYRIWRSDAASTEHLFHRVARHALPRFRA